MIVRVAHVAFVDFGLNPGPGCATPEQLAYVRRFGFGILMVELEHNRVRLGTVNTRMRSQILENPLLVIVSLGGVLVLAAQNVLRSVLGVVAPEVRAAATSAKVV